MFMNIFPYPNRCQAKAWLLFFDYFLSYFFFQVQLDTLFPLKREQSVAKDGWGVVERPLPQVWDIKNK